MVRMGVINDALKNMVNAEKAGKRQVSLIMPGVAQTNLKSYSEVPEGDAKAW
jgi:hypothetical protein